MIVLRFLQAGLAGLLLLLAPAALAAENAAFDLTGPSLRASVTHDGVTLPLSQVPNLSPGDHVRVAAILPAEQGARYRLVLAFLRGATNPPPEKWLSEARTWKPKEATIDAVVPEGAQQALVFLVPDTGGAFDAVESAVRQRPGAFVRAAQDLNQTMLDRTRLEMFLKNIRERPADEVARVSPILAESLAVKLDPACLERRQDPRAACMTQGQNAAVLADGQTSSIAQTLAGAPANIALQLAATPQAGYGYYSAYIGVLRDVARMFGAFQSAQLQFIPALSVQHEGETELLLNTVPSFQKPQSVLVAALPTVAPPTLPPLEAKGGALCLARPGLLLPVRGAPLAFSTDYAREMALRVATKTGIVELPVTADPARGGFVVREESRKGVVLDGASEGLLHGLWGFTPFEGPRFKLSGPGGPWAAGDATLVAGRETPLVLTGGAAGCVDDVWFERGDTRGVVPWTVTPEGGLALVVPLGDVEPGSLVIAVRSFGVAEPQRLKLRAFAEASRVDGFLLHAGDREGVLRGTRLDQIATLEVGGAVFKPGALGREGKADRLMMTTADAAVEALAPGAAVTARAILADGRNLRLAVTVAPPRPQAVLVSQSSEMLGTPAPVRLALHGEGLARQDARLTFSLRAEGATRFGGGDRIDVRAGDGPPVRLPVRLQDDQIAIATLEPAAALGDSAHGPLQFRVVQGEVAGEWRPLATLVRLPRIEAVTCAVKTCTVSGSGLFLLRSVAGVAVPDGFTGTSFEVPRPAEGTIALTFRDDPKAGVTVPVS